MKLKKVLRKVFLVLYWGIFGFLLMLSIQGKLSDLGKILLIAYFVRISINLLADGIVYVIRRARFCRIFKKYKQLLECLIYTHNERYKILLNGGNKPELEKCSKLFEECASTIIEHGPYLIAHDMALEDERKEIEDIINKAQKLKTTVVPQYNT